MYAIRSYYALPHGLRQFLADLHSAGAAVDFTALYPSGTLVDAPLPMWTRKSFLIESDEKDSAARGACTASGHPLLGEP